MADEPTILVPFIAPTYLQEWGGKGGKGTKVIANWYERGGPVTIPYDHKVPYRWRIPLDHFELLRERAEEVSRQHGKNRGPSYVLGHVLVAEYLRGLPVE